MPSVTVERDIAAPAAVVWELMTDVEAWPAIGSGIDRVERLDDGDGFGVGTRWRETRTLLGRQASEVMEVTAIAPGRSYTVESESAGTHYVTDVVVTPGGDHASHATMALRAEPGGLVQKALAATVGRLAAAATRKALARDLDDIATAAEGRAAQP